MSIVAALSIGAGPDADGGDPPQDRCPCGCPGELRPMGRWAPYRTCAQCGTGYYCSAHQATSWTPGVTPTADQYAFWGGREDQWAAIVGPRQGRLLDVGCGFGHFVRWAQARGWDAWGCDADPWARQQTVAPGRVVASPGAVPAPFDLITLWDVLEHVSEPVQLAGSLRPLLAPGGRLVVGSPNFASIQLRWPWLRLDAQRFNDVVKPDEHVVQFTGQGVVMTLERAGFTAVHLLHPPLSRRSGPVLNGLARRCSGLRRGLFASGVAG